LRNLLFASLAVLALASPSFAADKPPENAPNPTGHHDEGGAPSDTAKKSDTNNPAASAVETAQPRKRSIPLNGRTLNYTVTPGTLTIRNDDGDPIASVFYTAYTVDGPERTRPVTFLFNGGPGSSTMWLHMGSFGPLKIDASTPEMQRPAPFRFNPNPDTLLDKSDLVFIDAVTTGLSRTLGKAEPKDFFGVDQDLDAFTRAIQRYLTVYGRWDSPKFIIGESYGTLRAAGLANSLQDKGVQLNGVALVSSTLDIGLLFSTEDHTFVSILPTYAAAAWYHNRIANRPADLQGWLAQVRAFAEGPYALALRKGDNLPIAERDAIANQMAAYTGLSPQFIVRSKLRVNADRFRKELLRDQSRTIGRLDARFTGVDVDAAGEGPEFDPADASMSGAFVGALNNYLFHDLGFQTPLNYRPNNYAGIGGKWDWKHRAPGGAGPQLSANTAADLSVAMRQNPRLKVLSVNGLYDLATPFFGADYDIGHMGLEPAQRANITYRYYPSGHMVYIDPASARQLKADISAWYDAAR
jgi:carboxypeptidase C (cathepsin A)